mgnify:FL=1
MNSPFFSIIIPVYNGLSHDLSICLESIWQQPLSPSLYEVICVDDCSTDDTHMWLDEEATKHSNLRIIKHTVNKRQGGGRNTGMKAAHGRYIIFIDQDDYFHAGSIAKVYDHLQSVELEILIVDCTYERPGKVNKTLQHNFPHHEVLTGDEQILRNSIPWAPWKFIFLRSLVVDNGLFFDEKERIEDIDWVHRLVHKAQRTQYQPILFIHYLKNDASTTMTSYKSVETMYSTLRCGMRLYKLTTSDFAQCGDEIKQSIQNIGEFVFGLGLRNFLTCKDDFLSKRQAIQEIVLPYSERRFFLTKIAVAMPGAFSRLSNLMAMFSPFLLELRRKWKYRHLR